MSHRTIGKGDGYFTNSFLPLSHASQTLRLVSQAVTAKSSNQECLLFECKLATTKLGALELA